MNPEELQWNWNEFGKTDPLFAILTNPEKRGNRCNVDEFFTTGQHEIDSVIAYLKSIDFTIPLGRALDFGCGVGRLTQALCRYFERCDGVDFAASMIDLARSFNRSSLCRLQILHNQVTPIRHSNHARPWDYPAVFFHMRGMERQNHGQGVEFRHRHRQTLDSMGVRPLP